MLSISLKDVNQRINAFKINLLLDDPFKNPQGQVILIPFFEDGKENNFLFNKVDQLLNKKLSAKAKLIGFKGKKNEFFSLSLVSFSYPEVFVFGLGRRPDFSIQKFQEIFADILRKTAKEKIKTTAFLIEKEFEKNLFETGKILVEALYLSQYRFDKYKSEEEREKITKVEEMNIYIDKVQSASWRTKSKVLKEGIEFGKIVSEGIYLARDLVNEPASHLHPEVFVDIAFEIEKQSNGKIKIEILDEDECRKLGMGAFLGVAVGSERKPKFIILHYDGKAARQQNSNKKICLIGKTIIFDSGGLSLKSQSEMQEMKIDMAGGANVLAIFLILSKLKKPEIKISQEIYGLLPVCENMPSGKALKPGDIVTALNGKTIEVLNTDAEGRLTLADALSYAEKYLKPGLIIDFATLTGAVIISLGEDITGLFGNNRDFNKTVLKIAEEENEAIWELPLFENYAKKMKSDIADLKNVSLAKYGGAITAALFLEEFVNKKTKWVHLDIAGSSYKTHEEKGIISKGGTGWGVKTLIKLLQSVKIS